ncbi:hypothetical protein ACFPAG_09625 [Vogesella sp. GCM10023246]|uniref:Uncharacterized protein n=1 Tax=Vogesella oryzagri TaxID=3160864 RepID=A0ABV1M3R0_9NEIS
MIDSITGSKVLVESDQTYGSKVRLSCFEDFDILDDFFNEDFLVPTFTTMQKESDRGFYIYFGVLANLTVLQNAIDGVIEKVKCDFLEDFYLDPVYGVALNFYCLSEKIRIIDFCYENKVAVDWVQNSDEGVLYWGRAVGLSAVKSFLKKGLYE